MNRPALATLPPPDAGLLFLRLAGSSLLLYVHGLPKLLHYGSELQHIDDPLQLGRGLTLLLALFAEIVCPLLIAAGWLTRLATLPILFLLVVSILLVHPEWDVASGQFAWLLIIVFGSIALAGPGRYSIDGQR
ncbi:DoxX family protein [Vogesella sp. LIG4]|uniref:DoxX family protein n=1 Tax=Vogesella sp. LIG4 TaxID=1192162 RepID=UPI00081F8BB6|nr:DoxX family protein [Vogesella sp. LIG4]SCK30171.1 putative oxidoreductase [Vogesella sp. LIG4]